MYSKGLVDYGMFNYDNWRNDKIMVSLWNYFRILHLKFDRFSDLFDLSPVIYKMNSCNMYLQCHVYGWTG